MGIVWIKALTMKTGHANVIGHVDRVLAMLVEAAPKALSRSEILDRVWGEQEFPTQRTVDNAIVRLRQALGDIEGQLIRSVRGIGYQWAASSK